MQDRLGKHDEEDLGGLRCMAGDIALRKVRLHNLGNGGNEATDGCGPLCRHRNSRRADQHLASRLYSVWIHVPYISVWCRSMRHSVGGGLYCHEAAAAVTWVQSPTALPTPNV